MRIAKHQPHPAGSQMDEPIPFTVTPEGMRLLKVWRLTRFLRVRMPRFARN